MADLATLTLQVNASGAVTEVRKLNAELDRAGETGDRAAQRLGRALPLSNAQYRELQNEIKRSTALLSQMVAVTEYRDAKAVAGMRALIAQQREWAVSMDASAEHLIKITALENRFEAASSRAGIATISATTSVNRFRSGLTALATQLAGVNPVVAQLASGLSAFAVGSVLTVGLLAGVAAIALAYQRITRTATEAKAKVDDLIRSLNQQRVTARAATLEGQQDILKETKLRLEEEERSLAMARAARSGKFGVSAAAADLAVAGRERAEERVRAAKNAVRQAEINLQDTEIEGLNKRVQGAMETWDLQKAVEADAKRYADEDRKRAEEATREQKAELVRLRQKLDILLKIYALPDIGAVTANIDATLQANPIVDTIGRINGPPKTEAQKELDKQLEEMGRFFIEWNKLSGERLRAEDGAVNSLTGLQKAMQTASQTISQTVEYYLVSKLGGGGVAGSLGGALGKGAASQLGGFGATAVGGAIFGPILAGAGAYLGNAAASLGDSLFGLTGAAAAARAALRAMKESLAENINSFRIQAQGGATFSDREAEVRKDADKLRREAQAAYPGKGPWWDPDKGGNPEYAKRLAEITALEAQYLARLKEEMEIKRQQFSEDLQVRLLKSQGRNEEASALAATLANERELAEARRDGASAADLATLAEIHKAEAQQRANEAIKNAIDDMAQKAEDLWRATRRLRGDSASRGLSALGLGRQSEDVRSSLAAREEMEEAIKAGMSPATLAMLAFTQILERDAVRAAREIEDQTRAITDAADSQIRALTAQTDIAQESLRVNQDQLKAQERTVDETRRVFDTLTEFRSGLSLNTSLTSLSPTAQLEEARRQYEELLGQANGGNAGAAGKLPGAATSFLQASREVNASGGGYVSDFRRVQDTLASVTNRFGTQLSVEERILAELQSQSVSLEGQIKTLEQAKDQARADADKQISQMVQQVIESQKANASASSYYATFLQNLEEDRRLNDLYYRELFERLERLINETRNVGLNMIDLGNNIIVSTRKPGPEIPKVIFDIVAELKAGVAVSIAGTAEVKAELQLVRGAIQDNTSVTRQGLEAVSLT